VFLVLFVTAARINPFFVSGFSLFFFSFSSLLTTTGAMVSVASFRTRNSTAGETKTGGRPVSQRPSSNSAQQGGSERAVCQAIAVHTYTAEDDDDDGSALTFTKGQQMEILEISDDWWRARINGVEGWVPEQYIRRL
jgi:myosin-1